MRTHETWVPQMVGPMLGPMVLGPKGHGTHGTQIGHMPPGAMDPKSHLLAKTCWALNSVTTWAK